MKRSVLHLRSGFTLIEMVIAMTIFAMMSTIVMTIYLSVTGTSHRMNLQRELAETAREITERIGEDIGKYGFSGSASVFDPMTSYVGWNTSSYTDSGAEFLNLNNGIYVYGVKGNTGFMPCEGDAKSLYSNHCGLYFVDYSDKTTGYNLVDSFNPDESHKRVKMQDLKFYVSGSGTTSYKVMMNFTLRLTRWAGVSEATSEATALHIQTTFSQRSWKK